MLDTMLAGVPQEWKGLVQLLSWPLAWILPVQSAAWMAGWEASSWLILLPKRIFVLLPMLLFLAALWITMLSVYTLPFRSNRRYFIAALAMCWWDMFKATWLFWVGIVQFAFLMVGWLWGLLVMSVRILFEALKELILFPFRLTSQVSSRYFQPGVPWLAVLFTVFWCVIEAGVFTYTLLPTMTEVLSDLVGVETHRLLAPVLYVMLFLLIAGSFACLQVLSESVQQRKFKQIIQMLLVEFFVMFLEVFFLYRELVDSVTPWLAQQTGEQFRMGLYSTMTLATFGWLGIRGMTWFLFGRFGTPALLAIMSRQKLAGMDNLPEPSKPQEMSWAKRLLEIFRNDIDWFKQNAQQLAEKAVLPVLQVPAVALNFAIILVAGEPVLRIPLKSLEEVLETSEMLEKLALKRMNRRAGKENR